MAKYVIKTTSRFRKDVKKYVNQGIVTRKELEKVIDMLADDISLSAKYNDHKLHNNLKDYRDLHIKPDLLLIYKKEKDMLILTLCNLDSHSNLF